METIHITLDFKTLASKDFYIGEYWKGTDFDLPSPIILGGQIIRDYFGVQITVTNTYPDGQNFGYHRLMKAGDFCPSEIAKRQEVIEKYNQELTNYINGNGSVLIEKLRQVGIIGFGREIIVIS